MVTVTVAGVAHTPAWVEEVGFRREPGVLTHPILGSTVVLVTERPAHARSGRMVVRFVVAADAYRFMNALAAGSPAVVQEAGAPFDGTLYATANLALDQDQTVRAVWAVSFDYQAA